jgi:hypothetical protein
MPFNIQEYIEEAEKKLVSQIAHNEQFVGKEKLIARFDSAARTSAQNKSVRQCLEVINEIAAAIAIFQSIKTIRLVEYEPQLKRTPQRIDFKVQLQSGEFFWIEVKTIAPEWRDDDASWIRFQQLAEQFPSSARLVVDRALAGAALSGQAIKARWSFITRTLEVEKKARLLSMDEKAPMHLLFCSNGPWSQDSLEDFSDYYHTGIFREDDWARNAVAKYMEDREFSFSRELAGFGYLYFRWETIELEKFALNIRGPQ